MSGAAPARLRELAWGAGVDTGYHDIGGNWHETPAEVLQALLDALGLPAGSDADVRESHRALHRRAWLPVVEPTTVCWADRSVEIVVRRPAARAEEAVDVALALEDGGHQDLVVGSGHLAEVGAADVDGVAHVAQRLTLDVPLPLGVHRAEIRTGDRSGSTHLLVAPRRAPAFTPGWGVFAPVYALRRGRGAEGLVLPGNLGDLERLADWVDELGGNVVATLPLLATFAGEASPYAPVSRLAWSDRPLDLRALPEHQVDVASSGDDDEGSASGRVPVGCDGPALVDWASTDERLRAEVVSLVARLSDRRRAELDEFCTARPHVDELARWFAQVEASGPPPTGAGLDQAALAPEAVLRHRYLQWVVDAELGRLAGTLADRGQGLLLDLPLGVHPAGFDVWRQPELFARSLDVGAPPDDFNPGGQSWGFPPILPEASRADGHAYLRAGLAHQLRHAGAVRIDHVMALHRLWWVPPGGSAADGAYVHYPAEELAAVVALEATRAGAAVLGENLGTVPTEVDDLMADHGFAGMYATQFELDAAPQARRPPAGTIAVVNTHDMVPFAAFWADAPEEHRARVVEQLQADGCGPEGEDALAVLAALLGWLGKSEAASVIVTLEDLWGEPEPQNVPGTGAEQPNWQRLMARSVDAARSIPDIAERLDRLRAVRPGRVETGA